MVFRDVKADFGSELKTTIWSQKVDVRRLDWILGGQLDFAMVDALLEVRTFWALHRKMPFE
jgi:hypothetical protein